MKSGWAGWEGEAVGGSRLRGKDSMGRMYTYHSPPNNIGRIVLYLTIA